MQVKPFSHCKKPADSALAINRTHDSVPNYVEEAVLQAAYWDSQRVRAIESNNLLAMEVPQYLRDYIFKPLEVLYAYDTGTPHTPEGLRLAEHIFLGAIAMSHLLQINGEPIVAHAVRTRQQTFHADLVIDMVDMPHARLHQPNFDAILPPDDPNFPDGWYKQNGGVGLYVRREVPGEPSAGIKAEYEAVIGDFPTGLTALYPYLPARLPGHEPVN